MGEGIVELVTSNSSVPDYDLSAVVGEQHIRAVAKGLLSFSRQARADIWPINWGDKATTDLSTKIVCQTDKDLWFV